MPKPGSAPPQNELEQQPELDGIDAEYESDGRMDTPLGEPFALAHDVELLPRDDSQGVPGCYASVQCGCGELFKANLLDARVKSCPGCQKLYTHVLLWAPVDDSEIVDEFLDDVCGDDDDDDDDNRDDDDDHEEKGAPGIREAEVKE